MKKTSYLLSMLFLVVLTIFSACKPDGPDPEEETAEEKATRQLTESAFNVNTVTLSPDADYSFEGPVAINFQENNTFTISNSAELPNPAITPTNPLPASGTWAFSGGGFSAITLSADGTDIALSITTLDDTNLNFQYAGVEPKDNEVTVTVNASR